MTWKSEAARMAPVALLTVLFYLPFELKYWPQWVVFVGAMIMTHRRREHPVLVALVLALGLVPFPSLWIVTAWAYMSLATHLRLIATICVGLVFFISGTAETMLSESDTAASLPSEATRVRFEINGQRIPLENLAPVMTANLLGVVALAAIGSYVGSRRREAATMQDRLALAERGQELARANARAEERNRIAREMHDVLAHKITLISLHAGALAYRDDLTPEQVRDAGETIRASSHQALSELRQILGELRQTDEDSGAIAKPQPGISSLEELAAEHRVAGRKIELEVDVEGDPPEVISRHVYRVVQEALTNAARHAPGTTVSITVWGSEREGLYVHASNPISLVKTVSPGAGLGLVGLRERVELAGGEMIVGPDDEGNFVLEVWFEW